MKKINLMLLFLVISVFLYYGISLSAIEGGKKTGSALTKSTAPNQEYLNRTLVNIGQVSMWIYANGQSATGPTGSAPGLYFPRGNPDLAVIYQDGLVWGGIVNDGIEPALRVGGVTYFIGTDPGAITSKGVNEDLNDLKNVNRIWRIRKDFAEVTDSDLILDASEVFSVSADRVTSSQIQTLRDVYRQDWIDWPIYKGAPFYDAEGDGQYNPQFNADGTPILYPAADEPGYANGDQVVWLCTNDLNAATCFSMAGAPSIGLEMQATLWAYKRSDALGNIIFKEYRLMYKGRTETPNNATIDSMYVCQWSDPDNGQSGDDFAGCDTTLSLGYVYNASSIDLTYAGAGLPPPAGGYDFFAGPRVPDPAGSAVWHLKRIDGYRNLPMTSFGFFAAGQADSDPDDATYEGTLQWWNLLRGNRPRPTSPAERWTNPQTGEPTMFRVPGDPVTGTGWIDAGTGDRRILQVSGPFTMSLGDTTETVVAVIAALGSDRLSSVSVLKFYDRFAQGAFDVLFELPKAPPAPKVQATELDGEVFLNWGYDAAATAAVENFEDKGFFFEGYNVYQLPTAGAALSQGIKLATYDLVDEVTSITQESFDINSGLVLQQPVQVGKNSGIKRTMTIDWDRFRERPLANGRTYYFALTAYSYNPDPLAATKSLESTLAVAAVIPQTLKPGVRTHTTVGDTIVAVHEGPSDGNALVLVTDATRVTGDDYKVVFVGAVGPDQVWHLINTTKGDTVLKNQTNQTGDDNYLTVDGLTVIVTGAPNGFVSFQVVANAAGPLDPPEIGCFAFNANGFPLLDGSDRPNASRQQTNGSTWGINVGGGDGTYAKFLERACRGDNFTRIIPYDYEMRFTGTQGNFANWAFTTGVTAPVPFELWNIGIGTPDDPGDDYKMIPWVLDEVTENDVYDFGTNADGTGLDHLVSGGANDPYLDWVYFRNPRDTSPGTAGYDAFVAAGADYDFDSPEVLARTVLVNWNGGTVTDPTFPANVDAVMPEQGTIFRIITTKPNTSNDVFTFSTGGLNATTTLAEEKQDIDDINVFPNPYYGLNIVERDVFNRYVTFSHLPQKATIRVFSLAGILVRTIEKDNATQFATWNLQNQEGLPVASGVYIVYIDLPDQGKTKTLKVALVREQQFLPIY